MPTSTPPTSMPCAAELEEKHPTLHLVGRNGMHRYNNQDHAMMTAMLTVENILTPAKRVCPHDTWCVNEDAEYHEAGDEGDAASLPSRRLTEDQSAALASVRQVPERVSGDRDAT